MIRLRLGPRRILRWVARIPRTAADDGGWVALWLAATILGLMAFVGLLVDGGNQIAARERAADVAQQAARAGADALSPVALHTGLPGSLTADPAAATAAAQRVLSSGGVSGTVAVRGQVVTVHVTVHQRTKVLSAIGLTELSGSATASATPLAGTTRVGA